MPREFSVNEHKQLMELVELTDKFFKMHKVEYMIMDGSLIGSLRHWDVVPWDDDFVIFQTLF
jgi:phosphorylcholine metabolism protein LicD